MCIGSWSSLWDIAPHDAAGNYTNGEAVLEDTQNCYIHSEKGLVSTIGIKDLVIVDTPDALLVCRRDQAQRIREVISLLEAAGRSDLL